MKKRVFLASIFAAATIALLATSCSMNEPGELNVTTSDAISLNPNTTITRASVAALGNLEGAAGFVVYATTADVANDWYQGGGGSPADGKIDGTNNHKLGIDGKWNFVDKVRWPMSDPQVAYPMAFYAFYADDYNSITRIENPGTELKLQVQIPESTDDQVDIVAALNTANGKPASSNLSMVFGHILSKIHFTVTNNYKGDVANPDHTVYVQAVGFKNVFDINTYDLMEANPVNRWAALPTGYNSGEFPYFNKFFTTPKSQSKLEVATFNGVNDAGSNDAKFFTTTSTPAVPSPEWQDAFMMLLPQDAPIWNYNPATPAVPTATEAHVQLMYRWENKNSSGVMVDELGFSTAADHPDFDIIDYSIDGKGQVQYEGPLFLKVGFVYTPAWEMGKGYQYNIALPGTSGGNLLDKYYYDEEGNQTPYEVDGIEEGEPVLGDEWIHLIPKVTEWDDQPVKDVW